MKRNLLFIGVLFGLITLAGCGSDDGPSTPPHIVGTWELDSYIFINLPSAYASNEGRIFLLNEITFNNVAFEAYTLNLAANGTYTRKVEVPGPSLNDDGTWTLDGDDFVLDPEDSNDDNEFRLEKNEDDQFWISQESQFALIKDSVLDTLTQEYVDGLSNEEFNALFDPVSLDLVFAFERE